MMFSRVCRASIVSLSAALATAALCAAAWTGSALAQAPAAPQRPQAPATTPATPAPQTLATLYERLKAAASEQEAEPIVRQIARRWARSGSDTSDLLMSRARQALAQQNAPLAVELLDRLLALQPTWAEAWHVRGIAFFTMQDDGRALFDFRETLRREPGHFMALGMAAAAFRRQGNEKSALGAFKAARELHPNLKGVGEAIDKLVPLVEGRDT
jgi:tetratricopeptide (TPR) repeat protein